MWPGEMSQFKILTVGYKDFSSTAFTSCLENQDAIFCLRQISHGQVKAFAFNSACFSIQFCESGSYCTHWDQARCFALVSGMILHELICLQMKPCHICICRDTAVSDITLIVKRFPLNFQENFVFLVSSQLQEFREMNSIFLMCFSVLIAPSVPRMSL